MLPVPELKDIDYDVNYNQATVSWYYSDKIENPVFELQQKVDNGDWQTITSNLTEKSYIFTPETDKTYKFRVKESKNETWSEEVYFDPQKFLAQYNEVSFFPTLADNRVFVQYKNLTDVEIAIFSLDKKCVFYEKLTDFQGTRKEIDVSHLSRGVYIAKVKTPEDDLYYFRFVCEGVMQ
jgi:hypothetical protein